MCICKLLIYLTGNLSSLQIRNVQKLHTYIYERMILLYSSCVSHTSLREQRDRNGRTKSKFIKGDRVPYRECRKRGTSPTGEMIKVRNRRRTTRACPRQFLRNMSRVGDTELLRGVFDLVARARPPSGPAVRGSLSTFSKTNPPSHAPRTRRERRGWPNPILLFARLGAAELHDSKRKSSLSSDYCSDPASRARVRCRTSAPKRPSSRLNIYNWLARVNKKRK